MQGNAVFELPKIKLSDIGSVVNETIISLNEKYDNIIVEKYVIMPNHIHMIVTILASDDMFLDGMSGTPSHNLNGMSGTPSHNLNGMSGTPSHNLNGMSGTPSHNLNGMSGTPSPTNAAANAVIPSFVGTLKRFANKRCGFSMFQRSYYDHIIRNQRDYDEIWDYIDSNPVKWKQDCYYF